MTVSNAQKSAVRKYEDKTYKTFTFHLRIDEDEHIIKSIEDAKRNGLTLRQWINEHYKE